jgi:pimeloyl-ACP methyl ester carboxylesterase
MAADSSDDFAVTKLETNRPFRTVLFAVGRGGDPRRHLPFLEALAERGCRVVAPHFDMLASPVPSNEELDERIARLEQALSVHAPDDLPVIGVGHSIGSTMLLTLAGAIGMTMSGTRLACAKKYSFDRLVLLAPATAFFRKPGALDALRVPIRIWVGRKDAITPPDHAAFLQTALEGKCSVDVRVADDAGHFTFMNQPPPGMEEPHPDRDVFLSELVHDTEEFMES